MEVTVLAIQRDERFSPNSVDKDLAILLAVCDELKSRLCLADDIPVVSEKSFISEQFDRSAQLQKVGIGTADES